MEAIEQLARTAVVDVFRSMVSTELSAAPPLPLAPDPDGQIAGSVGFIGQASGLIYLYVGVGFAKAITGRMLGIPEPDITEDEMVNDAIGELSNMVGGYVKSHLCDDGWTCTLTIPSVVRGRELSIERVPRLTRKIIGFKENDRRLLVELLMKDSD